MHTILTPLSPIDEYQSRYHVIDQGQGYADKTGEARAWLGALHQTRLHIFQGIIVKAVGKVSVTVTHDSLHDLEPN